MLKSTPIKQIVRYSIFLTLYFITLNVNAQNIKVHPQTVLGTAPGIFKPGIFLIPKTINGENDFVNNGISYNSLRLIALEIAFDNSSPSINDIMATLELLKPSILYANSRCDKLVLPIMKMPLWLSSSNDTTLIGGGWRTFNGMPPANYNTWNVLMDSIVNKINGQWGLDPYYEIWNEPDIFYWQGTADEYFTFFKNTYFAIKSNHPSAQVGGPVVSSFTSKFGGSYQSGFISNMELDSSIIGRLIDSCVVWGAQLNFISWHKFDSYLYPIKMEIEYLNQKLISSGHGSVPYFVSEWNNTGPLRESHFAAAFMPNFVFALEVYGVDAHIVAAWQDFEMGTYEFHKDYGMLSWGSLHKPEWKSLLLLNKMKGLVVKTDSSNYLSLGVKSTIQNDTLRILVSNHSLPGYTFATSYLLYDFHYNESEIVSAGYSSSKLDSIYKGLIILTDTDSLSLAINSAIPIYQNADSVFNFGRNINLTVSGLVGTHMGQCYLIDSTENNVVYLFDSLLNAGYNRNTATTFLYPNSTILSSSITFTDSVYSFHLKPNTTMLLELYIPEISGVSDYSTLQKDFEIFPNPSLESFTIKLFDQNYDDDQIFIYNSMGALVKTIALNNSLTVVDVSELSSGIYFIQLKNMQVTKKYVKQ